MRLTRADLADGGWLQSVDAWFAPRVDNPVLAQLPSACTSTSMFYVVLRGRYG